MLNKEEQSILLNIAKETIKKKLGQYPNPKIHLSDYSTNLTTNGCSFVTLHKRGELRGCIGALEAYQPLIHDVAEHAIAAAFHDSRFPPLSEDEYNELHIEISILDTPSPMSFTNETDLLQQINFLLKKEL